MRPFPCRHLRGPRGRAGPRRLARDGQAARPYPPPATGALQAAVMPEWVTCRRGTAPTHAWGSGTASHVIHPNRAIPCSSVAQKPSRPAHRLDLYVRRHRPERGKGRGARPVLGADVAGTLALELAWLSFSGSRAASCLSVNKRSSWATFASKALSPFFMVGSLCSKCHSRRSRCRRLAA